MDFTIFVRRFWHEHRCWIVGFFVVLFIVGIVVVALINKSPTSSDHDTKASSHAKESYDNDDFAVANYTIPHADGHPTIQIIKFKFVEDPSTQDLLNFDDAKNACMKLNSTLWEIVDGQTEWDALLPLIKANTSASVWLNGEPKGQCEGLYNIIDIEYTCSHMPVLDKTCE